MAQIADIPLTALSKSTGEIFFSIKLYQCAPFYIRFPAQILDVGLTNGRRAAAVIDRRLTNRATRDQEAFFHLRERIRHQMVAVAAGKPAPEFGDNPKLELCSALLWLALHEPQKRNVLRHAVVECLRDGRAIIEMACGEKIAYVTTIGVNPKPQHELDEMMRLAEMSPASIAILSDGKHRTYH